MAKDGGIVIMASCQIEIAVDQRKTGSFCLEISLKGFRITDRMCSHIHAPPMGHQLQEASSQLGSLERQRSVL